MTLRNKSTIMGRLIKGLSFYLFCLGFFSCIRLHAAQSIMNDRHVVSVEAAEGSFSVTSKPGGKPFLTGGKLTGTGGTAKVIELSDKTFGKGKGIQVTYPDGNKEMIAIYPNLPFVLFNNSFHNGGAEPVTLNHVPTVSGMVNLGKPLAEIRTLGTGGLLKPADNPGSYAFLSVVDPATRSGVVGGWITEDRASGVVFSPVKDNAAGIQARLDYGRLRIKPGQDAASETFALGYFDDARFGLEAYADAITKVYSIKLHPARPGYCTWYMEKYGMGSDEKHLAELSAYAAKNLKPFGFDFIQVDDGWQMGEGGNGPAKVFSAFNPKGPYPSGMKATADNVKKLGLTPGIWFMPFAGKCMDPFFRDHQDWFVKNVQGQPYDTEWGGTCLDMTNPTAREYLRSVVQRIAHEWGFQLFKMDGFWTGSATKLMYVNNGYKDDGIGDAVFLNPDKTNIEALRDGVRLVREAAGPDVFFLGCTVAQNMRAFGGAFGLLDAMRLGPDTGNEVGSLDASRLWFLNGRVWWNDPDSVSVWNGVPPERARLNATFTSFAGDLFYNSNWMPDFPAERLDILRRCMPPHGMRSRPVDVFENEPARIWHLADPRGGRRDVVALYNWGMRQETFSALAARIGLPPAKQYVAFDFWRNKFLPPFEGELRALMAPGSCRVLAIRPVSDHPQLLSTSRHITQGIVDVTGETWNAASLTLAATSKVVANDPYELRIVTPLGTNSFRVAGVTVSEPDKAAGVTAAFTQDGPRVRATLSSPVSRDIQWQVRFEKGEIVAAPPRPVTSLRSGGDYRVAWVAWDDNGADFYRVTRNDGTTLDTMDAGCTDRSLERGTTYKYTVASVGWDNKTSAPASVEVRLAEMKQAPPVPPAPDVSLDVSSINGVRQDQGAARINKSVGGKPLTIEGKTYEKGLGVHAYTKAITTVPAGATRFVARVGLDDEVANDPRASVVFEVYGDPKVTGENPVLLSQSPILAANTARSWAFDIELNPRFKELLLVVNEADDDNTSDVADWVNAGFIVAPPVTPASKQ